MSQPIPPQQPGPLMPSAMPGPGMTVGYDPATGRNVYVPQQQPIIVQIPAQERREYFPPWLIQFLILIVAILGAVVVLVGSVCAVVVLMGGTLIGIIGAATAALPYLAVTTVAIIVAAGWAAGKIKPLMRGNAKNRK